MKLLPFVIVSMMSIPCMAVPTSDPAGSRRQQAVEQYADPASCLAALDEWVRSSREKERGNPTRPPSTWRLNGPQRAGSSISYDLTRIAVQDYGTNRHTVAYIYVRSCDGRAMTVVADGWVTDDLLPPSLP